MVLQRSDVSPPPLSHVALAVALSSLLESHLRGLKRGVEEDEEVIRVRRVRKDTESVSLV